MHKVTTHQPPKYREDIDGLRAVAVLLVVLEHLRVERLSGGYVGVDVFFVISGYLIGSSMLTEFRAGTFSLRGFLERRVRRILPALLAMLAFTSVVAYRHLLAGAFAAYSRSMLSALLSCSNIYFWTQEGYFVRTSSKPLLHTWSLGVEEQFYLLLPLLLYAVFRWQKRRLCAVLWSLLAVSFLAACLLVRWHPATAFFWSPLRVWELLAGTMVSQYGFALLRLRWVRELASASGLCLVLFAASYYSIRTEFPGWTAVAPCFGAVLIIAAGQVGTSAAGRLLALPPLRFIGLISYSLYLWHWPLVSFQTTNFILNDGSMRLWSTRLLVLVASLAVATLSWWLVETPFRKGVLKPSRRALFAITGAGAALLAGFSLWVVLGHGLKWRLPTDVQRLGEFDEAGLDGLWRSGSCFLQPKNSIHDFNAADCLGRAEGRKTYLLYGDSTAAQLYPGMVKIFPQIHFQVASAAGCPPYQAAGSIAAIFQPNCTMLFEYIQGPYLSKQRPDAVVLAAAWFEPDFASLTRQIGVFQARGIPVILVGPVLGYDLLVPGLVSFEMQRHRTPDAGGADIAQHRLPGGEALDRQMADLARTKWHVRYISHYTELCRPQQPEVAWQTPDGCPLMLRDGQPMVFDSMHFTEAGSLLFAGRVRADGLLP